MTGPEREFGGARPYRLEATQKTFAELTGREVHDILALRNQVFVVEQNCVYNDVDGRDADDSTQHVWIEHGGEIAAYLRQLDEGDGVQRIGRVVTHPTHRGHGLAARLISQVVGQHDGPIVLDAQSPLFDWYARFGFRRDGEEFLDDGIAHIPMRRDSMRRDPGSHPPE